MKKEFYIIVPFDTVEWESVRDTSFFSSFKSFWSSINWADDILKIRWQIKTFSKIKKWLVNRSNQIKTSLEWIWIKATELNKSELIKYMTDYYNPNMEDSSQYKWDNNDINLVDIKT
jgi:hypothetical protein